MNPESKKRVADLISQLSEYEEVSIVPDDKQFTISVNGTEMYSSSLKTFQEKHGHWHYNLSFKDRDQPYGARISPQQFQASTAVELGRATSNPEVKITAKVTGTIDGVAHANAREFTFTRKDLEEAVRHPNNAVLRTIQREDIKLVVYEFKKVFYLSEAMLSSAAVNNLQFEPYYERLDSADWKSIDELTNKLAKRSRRLSYYKDQA